MEIPFVDLKIQYQNYKTEIDKAIFDVINDSVFIKGKYVERFENEFASKCDSKYCIGVANGTDALFIILKMLGIGKGDEVITTSLSWISTSETISLTGAKPVFIDTDDYYLIDTYKIKDKITEKTKAIIPVHLYGNPCDMDKIIMIANEYKLFVIEDCAQAHFAMYNEQKVGTFSDAATFSFYPGKNLGAYGDAGAIVTNDKILAEKCRMFSNHGALHKHNHLIEGINSRLDSLQAAILLVKLNYIDEWNRKRYENAVIYNKILKSIPNVKIPKIKSKTKHIFHIYCILAEKRDYLRKYLNEKTIATQIHYPTILPLMPAYSYLNYQQKDFPKSSLFQKNILSLPMYPELKTNEIKFVCDSIKEFYEKYA